MGLVFLLFLFLSIPTAAGAQHFWKLLLAGSLSGGRQLIISPAVDMGIRCRAGGGGGGGGVWKRLHSRFVKSEGEEGICVLLTWKWL